MQQPRPMGTSEGLKDALFNVLKRGVATFRTTGIQNRWPIKEIYPRIFQELKPAKAQVLGHEMFLDARDSLKLSLFNIYEPFETSLLERFVSPGDVVLDVGANIGYYTLLLARRVGPTGVVHAFEPEPSNFALLEKNVRHNGYDNVVLHNAAVSDQAGKTKLFLSSTNFGDHQVFGDGEGRASIDVDQVRIDDVLAKEGRPIAFIKMDVQGAEIRAIQGMTKTLAAAKTLRFFTEIWPEGLRRCDASAATYLDLLESLGFRLELIDEAQHRLEPLDRPALLRDLESGAKSYGNLLCSRP